MTDPIEIRLPRLNANDDLVKLVRWLVNTGDRINVGDAIAELESSKATVEYNALSAGIIEIRVVAGAEFKIGQIIAVMHSGSVADILPGAAADPGTTASSVAVKVSDKARVLARQYGIEPEKLRSSGLVTEKDVQRAVELNAAKSSPVNSAEALAMRRPLTSPERAMARTVAVSRTNIAAAHMTRDMDASGLDAWLKMQAESRKKSLSVADVIISAVGESIKEKPSSPFRSTIDGEDLVQYERVDIGLAVDVGSRLVIGRVPEDIWPDYIAVAARRFDLAMRVAKNQISPTDITGCCFTVSVIDGANLDWHFPIIPPGQSGILGVTGFRKVPVVSSESISVSTVLSCCLAYDHRFITGMTAARFLDRVAKAIVSYPSRHQG